MKLDFYYWSYQCLLNNKMLELLSEYKDVLNISTYDISDNQVLPKELHMVFPTLIIANDKYRYFSPLRRHFLDLLVHGDIPKELPYIPVISTQVAFERIVPLTNMICHIASQCSDSKERKVLFLNQNK